VHLNYSVLHRWIEDVHYSVSSSYRLLFNSCIDINARCSWTFDTTSRRWAKLPSPAVGSTVSVMGTVKGVSEEGKSLVSLI
jgi:hypothetical protein